MTGTKTVGGRARLLLAVAAVLALLATMFTPAPAAAHQDTLRWRGALDVYDHYVNITDGQGGPAAGVDCATDINGLSFATRLNICKLKEMGAWSGTTFKPYNNFKRDQGAKFIRKAGLDARNRYPGRTKNISYGLSTCGWGHTRFSDVHSGTVTEAQDRGIGCMAHYNWENGPGGGEYDPNKTYHRHGLLNDLDKWEATAD